MHDKTKLSGTLYRNITAQAGTLGTVTKVEGYKVGPQVTFAITQSSGTIYLKSRQGILEIDTANDEWNSPTGTQFNLSGQ